MRNFPLLKPLLVSTVSVMLLAACGSAAQPTPTTAPASAGEAAAPTDAPVAETQETTSAEPTATSAPAEAPAAPAENSLFARLTGAAKSSSFTTRTTMQVTGDIMDAGNAGATDKPVTVFEMEQSYAGTNTRTVIRNREAGSDKSTEIEMRVVDGKTYMKGMMGSEDAEAEQWIVLPGDQSTTQQSAPVDAQQAIDSLTTNPEEAAGYAKTGMESMDGQNCDVYSTQKSNLATMGLMSAYSQQFEKVDKAEIRIVMCPDGQMHQMKIEIAGTSKKSPGTPASFVFETRMFDFGKNIAIEVPENIMEMPTP